MFTGLIETVGHINSLQAQKDIWLLDIAAPSISTQLKNGDSVAVSGACLTVVSHNDTAFTAQMMDETASRTKLGKLKTGDSVNLERAMRADSRFDGHIVSGHVDGVAQVAKIEANSKTKKFFFSAADNIISGIVSKGSVTIDGVSLTVIDADGLFSVELIPTTLAETSLCELQIGSSVNIETDILGKYVARYIETHFAGRNAGNETVTWEKLAENGWL